MTNLRRLCSPSCAKISREPIRNHDFAKRRTTAAGINEYWHDDHKYIDLAKPKSRAPESGCSKPDKANPG